MVVDSVRQLAPLGDLDPILAAPLTDAAVTPYRAIRRSLDRLGPGSVAVVIGIGGLGHLAVQILRAVSPATVVAVDSKPAALKLAASLGAHHTVEAGADAATAINELTKGRGVDATFDLVGNEATLALAFAIARGGLADHARRCRRRLRPVLVLGHQVRGRAVDVEWGSINDLRDVIALARSGLIEPKVTTYGFDQIPEAFHELESGTLEGRAVIVP